MRIAVVGAPADLGASRRGTDMGPSAIRYAKLREQLVQLGHDVVDRGNIDVPVAETRPAGHDQRLRFEAEILAMCAALADVVEGALRDGLLPLVLGGDHSVAMGTLGGVARIRPDGGLIWIDAHGDYNTPETTPSGNIHGMPLAAITGRGAPSLVQVGGVAPKVRPERVALVAIRDIDPLEGEALRGSGIHIFTMKEVDRMGIGHVVEEALARIGGGAKVHLSFDLDAIDPRYAPGVGTPVPGGLTYREAHLALELLADAGVLGSLELVEVNPILDRENETAALAVELAASALGKRIL